MDTEQTERMNVERDGVIIFLEPNDDVATARTKLEGARGRQVALVVPPHSALRRSIAIRLLRRISEGFAIELSIVTADGEVHRLAREEGLHVFSSVRTFRSYLLRAPRETSPASQSSRAFERATRLIVAAGSLVAMILIVAVVAVSLIPSATVTLRPATEPIGESIELRADPETRTIDYVARRVPARAIYDKVEGTDQVPVTGAGQSAEARAEGRVTFKNRTAQEVFVPPGTIVMTPDGVKFEVIAGGPPVHLAPARGAWAQTDVRAVNPGPKGNVPRGAISQVEGPLSQQVDVLNEEATTSTILGGLGTVTEGDQQRLRDQLLDRLNNEALAKLKGSVRDGELLPPQTIRLVTLEENYDRRVGEQAKALNLRMEVRVSGTAFDLGDVNNLAERAWQPRLRTGFGIVPESIRLLPPEVARMDGDVVVLRVRVDAVAAARISGDQVASIVRFQRPRAAVDELARTFTLAEPPQVDIEPGWAKRAFRLAVVINNE